MKKKIWIVLLGLMALTAVVDTVSTAYATTPTKPPGTRR